jgi:hypothetical protein
MLYIHIHILYIYVYIYMYIYIHIYIYIYLKILYSTFNKGRFGEKNRTRITMQTGLGGKIYIVLKRNIFLNL